MSYTKEKLEQDFLDGEKMKFLFFWGHKKNHNGEITSSCFSQWWEQKFIVDGLEYRNAEQYMMAEKARLFNDKIAEERILNSDSPGAAKKVGREVLNFDQDVWNQNRMEIVVKGNYHKFKQNSELETYLLNTNRRILVESSPVDTIWGIGLDKTSDLAYQPNKWRGLNLLGFALMEVRDLLNNEKK